MQVSNKIAAFLLGVSLAACSSDGELTNIFWRKASWASFLSGEDIAESCNAQSGERYRLVYNANRAEQVRIYDLMDGADGPVLRGRLMKGRHELRPVALGDVGSLPDPVDRRTAVTPDFATRLKAALVSDGVTQGAPVGRRMFSGNHFWLAAVCMDGSFSFMAWEHPDAGFKALGFPDLLYSQDPIDEAVNDPETDARVTGATIRHIDLEADNFEHYDVVVREKGVVLGRTYGTNKGPE